MPRRLLPLALFAGLGATPAAFAQLTTDAADEASRRAPDAQQPAPRQQDDAAQPQPAVPNATTLDTILVRARAQSLYKTEDSSLATRTDTPLQLVPQAIQVVPRQLIEDQAAIEVTDLYRNVSGVSYFSYSGVTMRGFRQDDALYDGLRGDPYAGFAVPRLFSVSEVQVLKGSSGSTYGESDPGGVINYTSKKPTHSRQNMAKLRVGDDDFHAASVESSGPIDAGKRWRYRIGGYVDGEHPYRYNTERDTRIGEAAIATDVGTSGEWLLQVTDIAQELPGNRLRGVLVDDDGNFLTTRRWNAAEADDYLKHHAQAAFSRLSLSPNEALDLNFAARWFRNHERQRYHEPRGLAEDGHTVNREFRDQRRWNRGLSTNANAVLRFATGALAHRVLVGTEYYWQLSDLDTRTALGTERGGPVPGIDLFNPQYGQTGFDDYGFNAIDFRRSSNYLENHGVYLQDQVTVGEHLNLLGGLRWERFQRENRVSGDGLDAEDVTWRLGATYAVVPSTNVYATVGTSFRPQSIGSYSPLVGGPFPPQRGRTWEMGTKSRFNDGAIGFNTAIYRIERSNLLQSTGEDPGNDGEDDLALFGLVRSKGVELDLLADVTDWWVVNLSYSYNDAVIKEGAQDPNTAGNSRRFVNAPRNKFGAWTRFEIAALKSALGVGAEYMGERTSFDGQRVKPYTVFDLSWQTRVSERIDVQANVKNLFDKVYAASGFSDHNGHFPGEPRRVYLEMRYRF
jgi:iron complex outermembrane receptor protein